MTRRIHVALAMLVLIPTLATAQRTRGGSGGGDPSAGSGGGGGGGGGGRAFKLPSRGDLEDMNPASFLLDKKKKLGLSDEQVAAIKVVEGQIKERYKVNLAVYDSLRRNARPIDIKVKGGSGTSPGEQAEMQKAMQGVQMALMTVRNQRTADIDATLAAITDPAMKAKAVELIKDQELDFARLMPGGDRDR
jgi:hypothetical protein